MKYRLLFKPRAEKDIAALSAQNMRRVLERAEGLKDGLSGDVKRLTNFTPEYRLRFGDYRMLFQVDGTDIIIYRVVHRRDAYR
jgi:mRNA interferase RelE/StbE